MKNQTTHDIWKEPPEPSKIIQCPYCLEKFHTRRADLIGIEAYKETLEHYEKFFKEMYQEIEYLKETNLNLTDIQKELSQAIKTIFIAFKILRTMEKKYKLKSPLSILINNKKNQ